MISELMKLDLPAPVAPATSRCGIFARLATTKPPSTSLPRPTTIGWWSARGVAGAQHVAEADRSRGRCWGSRCRSPTCRGSARGSARRRSPRRRRCSCDSAVTRSTLTAVAELDLVARHGRAAREAGDLGVDARTARAPRSAPRRRRRWPWSAPCAREPVAQDVGVGQRVGDVAGEQQLLDPLRQRACAAAARASVARPVRRRAVPALAARPSATGDRTLVGLVGVRAVVGQAPTRRRRPAALAAGSGSSALGARSASSAIAVGGRASPEPVAQRARPRAGSRARGVAVTTSRPKTEQQHEQRHGDPAW